MLTLFLLPTPLKGSHISVPALKAQRAAIDGKWQVRIYPLPHFFKKKKKKCSHFLLWPYGPLSCELVELNFASANQFVRKGNFKITTLKVTPLCGGMMATLVPSVQYFSKSLVKWSITLAQQVKILATQAQKPEFDSWNPP